MTKQPENWPPREGDVWVEDITAAGTPYEPLYKMQGLPLDFTARGEVRPNGQLHWTYYTRDGERMDASVGVEPLDAYVEGYEKHPESFAIHNTRLEYRRLAA